MVNKKKVVASLTVAVVAVVSSYFFGLTRRPSYKELPPKAQIAVNETNTEVRNLLDSAIDKYMNGNIKEAVKEFNSAIELCRFLEKIDPEYRGLEVIIHKYQEVLNIFNRIIEHIEYNATSFNRIKTSKETSPKTPFVAIYPFDGMAHFIWTNGPDLKKENPQLLKATLSNYITLIDEYLVLLEEMKNFVEKSDKPHKEGEDAIRRSNFLKSIQNVREALSRVSYEAKKRL